MRNWWKALKEDRRLRIVVIFAALLVPFLILRLAVAPLSTPEDATVQEQAEAVAAGSLYQDFPGDERNAPVRIMDATEYLGYIADTENAISSAVVNPDATVTSVVGTVDGVETISAARLIETQLDRAVATYNQRDIAIAVTQPGEGSPARFPTAVATTQSSALAITLTWLFVALVIGLAFFILLRSRVQGGSQMDRPAEGDEIPTDRFSDVAGCDEAVEDLQELVMFLKDPTRFTRTGAKPPRGALLVGPPGTGKTLLARAVAGEAHVPFYATSGSEFTEMFVGVGASRVRKTFKKARKHPEGAIIFIDEIDAIGRKRTSAAHSVGNQEQESTLNQLLVEMDGFRQSKVVVIAATNRDDILDPALKRPGRLDRIITVGLPDRRGRESILATHCEGRPIASDVDLALMARRTPGMSGADLAQVINEACLHAARNDRDEVTAEDFDSALATVAMGKARTSAVVSDNDRRITAWHEAGHTVAAMVVPDADPPVSVSIIPRGPAGGVTWMAPGDDLFLTRRRAFARLIVAMSGRAAEEILLDGEFTSGPHGDLQSATDLAMAMVTQYGMTDIGLMTKSEGLLSVGGKATDESVDAVEHLLGEALAVARTVLADHMSLLEEVANALLENDTLGREDLLLLRAGAESREQINPRIEHSGFQPPRSNLGSVVAGEGATTVEVARVRIHEESPGGVVAGLRALGRRLFPSRGKMGF